MALFLFIAGHVSRSAMPYQVKAGSITAIVANEKQALAMLRRLAAAGRGEISVRDIFGDEIDVATLESWLHDFEREQL
jgi:hypothetical protein